MDERRGIHLLSPGDIVRYGDLTMTVSAVSLGAHRKASVVVLCLPEAIDPIVMPLDIVEGSCEVYLRAEKPTDH